MSDCHFFQAAASSLPPKRKSVQLYRLQNQASQMSSMDLWQQKYPASLLKMQVPRLRPQACELRMLTPGGSRFWPELPQTLEQVLQEGYYRYTPKQPGVEMRGGGRGAFVTLYVPTIAVSPWHSSSSSSNQIMTEGPRPVPFCSPITT